MRKVNGRPTTYFPTGYELSTFLWLSDGRMNDESCMLWTMHMNQRWYFAYSAGGYVQQALYLVYLIVEETITITITIITYVLAT
jgi:hypothetical protein